MNEGRISNYELFMQMAILLSKKSTCKRREVGCVIVDRNNVILSTGFNGVPSGVTHCISQPCDGALSKSGYDLDKCEAVHAEINAIIKCADIRKIHTIYCTTQPCVHCAKVIANTSCRKVVYLEEYPNSKSFGGVIYEKYEVIL